MTRQIPFKIPLSKAACKITLLFLFLPFAVNCSAAGPATENTTTQPLTIQTTGGSLNLDVEIADDDAERAQGLMYREVLDEDDGMLFVFDDEAQRSFWMQNTPLSLDMIFISSTREIVYIEDNTTPYSTDAIVPEPAAQYVLEVNGGYCERHGVGVGDTVAF